MVMYELIDVFLMCLFFYWYICSEENCYLKKVFKNSIFFFKITAASLGRVAVLCQVALSSAFGFSAVPEEGDQGEVCSS